MVLYELQVLCDEFTEANPDKGTETAYPRNPLGSHLLRLQKLTPIRGRKRVAIVDLKVMSSITGLQKLTPIRGRKPKFFR